MENNKYRLVGVINLLDAQTDFVIPVFENEGVYFTQAKTNPLKIDAFDFLLNPEMLGRIQLIQEFDNILMPNKKFEYVEGDDVLYGFQTTYGFDGDNKELFLGNFKDFKKYFNGKEMDIHDYIYVQDSIHEASKRIKRG